MTGFQYQISTMLETKTALIQLDNALRVVPGTHPYWDDIVEYLVNGSVEDDAEDLSDLLELDRAVGKYLRLSDRLDYRDGRIEFDGDVVDNDLTSTLVKMIREEKDSNPEPLAKFFENLATNPSEASKASLWRWVQNQHLTITDDGHFIAYKGLTTEQKSVHAGAANVNGEHVKGFIPNEVGSVITMPRSTVDDNTHNYCSTGLHAGNWRYASGFGAKVVAVKINPRDVVSVPLDSNNEKLRCCRYEVVEVVAIPTSKVFWNDQVEDDADTDDDDHDCCCDSWSCTC